MNAFIHSFNTHLAHHLLCKGRAWIYLGICSDALKSGTPGSRAGAHGPGLILSNGQVGTSRSKAEIMIHFCDFWQAAEEGSLMLALHW